uniref:Uncharacterized protein n=1 Tax=Rhizophora mucronata TaxID=61149 RepID=A0A2P2LTW4_RHIMU
MPFLSPVRLKRNKRTPLRYSCFKFKIRSYKTISDSKETLSQEMYNQYVVSIAFIL